jgi:hypothetical protein
MGEGKNNLPVSGRVYPDQMFMTGLKEASRLTFKSEDSLLFEYGRYFMLNGLTEYLCGYLLAQAWCGYDLLLLMREAHAQMRRTAEGLTPPLFSYEILSNDHNHMIMTYDSDRRLCSLLNGCIHGGVQRFGEKVRTRELSCMKKGDPVCRFEVIIEGEPWAKHATPAQIAQEKERLSKQGLTNLLLEVLPYTRDDARDIQAVKLALDQNRGPYMPEMYQNQRNVEPVHISQILTGLSKLQQIGLVASTMNEPGDTMITRRYWRAPMSD